MKRPRFERRKRHALPRQGKANAAGEFCLLILLFLVTGLAASPSGLLAQGTSFTYQGMVTDGPNPANGSYDLSFALYNDATQGTVSGILTNAATSVTNGRFTVTLDFGPVFNGTNFWLELGIRTNGSGGFTTLSPRQPLQPTPYAIFSANAGSAVTANTAATAITAASANSIAATNIVGTVPFGNLPAAVVTNNGSYAYEAIAYDFNPFSRYNGYAPKPPKGANMFFSGYPNTNEVGYRHLLSLMVSNGMAANGYDTLLMDGPPPGGFDSPWPTVSNGVPYYVMTNGNGVMDFDKTYFPSGGQALCDFAHTNGLKIGLYLFNRYYGGGKDGNGTYSAQPGYYGDASFYPTLSNAVLNWKIDYIKDEVSGSDPTNAYRISQALAGMQQTSGHGVFWNVAAPAGYQPWYRGLFDSWRVGVGLFGDINFVYVLYLWMDMTPFGLASPTSMNDFDDECGFGSWGFQRSQVAAQAMANASILLGHIPAAPEKSECFKPYNQPTPRFYEFYDNPLLNAIDNDYASPMELMASNHLVVTYRKLLSDNTWAVMIQNRSGAATNHATIYVTNFYKNCPVFTIHDVFLNAPVAVCTNRYTTAIDITDVAWFKIVPGVEQVLSVGTNDLTCFPWSDVRYAYNGISMNINQYGQGYLPFFPYAVNNSPANGTNATGIIAQNNYGPNTNYFTWNINGNGQTLTCQLGSLYSATYFQIYGDGTLLWSGSAAQNGVTNISVNLNGVNRLTIASTNTATSVAIIGSPKIYCNYQTVAAPDGSTRTYSAASSPSSGMVIGNGAGLTNVPADAITGGLTINLNVLAPDGSTNILCFTNGILRAVH